MIMIITLFGNYRRLNHHVVADLTNLFRLVFSVVLPFDLQAIISKVFSAKPI
jgi:hypothetical protein